MLKSSTKGFDEPLFLDLQKAVVDLPRTLEDLALEATVKLEADLKEIYVTAPPRGSNKFVWSANPKKQANAARYYFGAIARGEIQTDGKHYKREGEPPYGVTANLSQQQHSVLISVNMTDSKMRFPFGQLQAKNTQLPGHRATGWGYAYPKVTEAMQKATNYILDGIAASLEGI